MFYQICSFYSNTDNTRDIVDSSLKQNERDRRLEREKYEQEVAEFKQLEEAVKKGEEIQSLKNLLFKRKDKDSGGNMKQMTKGSGSSNGLENNGGDGFQNKEEDHFSVQGQNERKGNSEKTSGLDIGSDTEQSTHDPTNDGIGAHSAMQMKLVNGELVIDESTVHHSGYSAPEHINNTAANEQFEMGTGQSTYTSFRKRQHTEKWTKEENKRFFEALRCYGTDFSMMEHVFPGRTRKQLRAKYKREEKANFDVILKCLERSRAITAEEMQISMAYIEKELKEKELDI